MAGLREDERRGVAARMDAPDSGSALHVVWSKVPGGLVQLYLELRHSPGERPTTVTWNIDPDDADLLATALMEAARQTRDAARTRWGASL